jgi:hypothetical protein
MKKIRTALIGSVCLLGLAAGTIAIAQPAKDSKGGQPEMKLPAGWTQDEFNAHMQSCQVAGTPGEKHQWLAKGAGTWHGKSQMWMLPGMDPVKSDCSATVTSLYDNRYVKTDIAAEIPGMGAFLGTGISGFDNVSQKFVSTWYDSHSTGIMQGTGELSADGKTLTWKYAYNCPVTKKPATMREVQTYESDNSMTFEMFATDTKTGKEFKCMHIDYTRQK